MDGLSLNSLTTSLNRKLGQTPARSVIDAWLAVTGSLKSEGEILVEGRVEGDIRCKLLVIGKDAHVSGSIIAEEVSVRGKVRGAIRAHRVTLQDTAVIDSDIYHRTLSIEQGACFEGSSKRCADPLALPQEPSATQALKSMAQEMAAATAPPHAADEAAA